MKRRFINDMFLSTNAAVISKSRCIYITFEPHSVFVRGDDAVYLTKAFSNGNTNPRTLSYTTTFISFFQKIEASIDATADLIGVGINTEKL